MSAKLTLCFRIFVFICASVLTSHCFAAVNVIEQRRIDTIVLDNNVLFNPILVGINHGLSIPAVDSSFTCFRSAASGTCGAATAHYFNAACDGVTDDSPALAALTAFGVAANPTLIKVNFPFGSKCHFAGQNTITWDINASGNGINNMLIVAVGASVDIAYFGGEQFFQDSVHSALIASVSAGASSLTVTDGNVGRFANGDYIKITGDCLDSQSGGFPPIFQFYDSTTISNIVGTTIPITTPTTYAYKSTWPVCSIGNMGNGGPATIFRIPQNWNTHLQLYGLTITNPTFTQINFNLRQAELYAVTVQKGTIAPSAVDNFVATNSTFVDGVELDKEADAVQFVNSTIGQMVTQDPSPKRLIVANSVETCSFNGTPLNTTITNTVVQAVGCDGRIGVGTPFFGHGNSVSVTGGSFAVAAMETTEFPISDLTSYSNGIFVIAKSAGSTPIGAYFQTFVPGFEYKLSFHNAFQGSCTPLTTFFVIDLREDASNYYADTGTWVQSGSPVATPVTLPSLSCGGTPTITPYPAQTITQSNTGASPSLTIFAPTQ